MGIISFLQKKSHEAFATTPIYVLIQSDKGWAQMHRNNFERYLKVRGYTLNEDVFRSMKIAMNADPSMTYEDFVDTFLDEK